MGDQRHQSRLRTASAAGLRVKILTCIPSPYVVDLFDVLAQRGDFRLDALYWREKEEYVFKLAEGAHCPARVMKRCALRVPGAPLDPLCPEILREVWAKDYDVFIVAGIAPTPVAAMFALTLVRRPWLFWSERPHAFSGRSVRDTLRRAASCAIGRLSRGVLAIGKLAEKAYRNYGVPAWKIRNVPYTPDLSGLLDPEEASLREAAVLRRALGGDGKTVFLFCGQLIPRKGVDILVRAFQRCRDAHSNCTLVIVGDGSERGALEASVPASLGESVRFVGAVQRPELLYYYLAADVFAFPSRYDGWGVVVNEAMGAGLPVITTDQVGRRPTWSSKERTATSFPRKTSSSSPTA
jgi:glycosyltransferase involved in cell wall biosynthesis